MKIIQILPGVGSFGGSGVSTGGVGVGSVDVASDGVSLVGSWEKICKFYTIYFNKYD